MRCTGTGSALGSWSATTLLDVRSLDNKIVPLTFVGSLNSQIFKLYLKKELHTIMSPRNILVIDNLSSKKLNA